MNSLHVPKWIRRSDPDEDVECSREVPNQLRAYDYYIAASVRLYLVLLHADGKTGDLQVLDTSTIARYFSLVRRCSKGLPLNPPTIVRLWRPLRVIFFRLAASKRFI